MTAKSIMIQGTMSSAGKSLLVTGLCRLFHREGIRVAPFKSQNMALNSCVTGEGLEMGRAQAVQAMAAGQEPSVLMNPVLLKPTSDHQSQVILQGEVWDTMDAKEYYRRKKELIPYVQESFDTLAARNELIVIEGAGSPAEINLREHDFVNMGMAAMADAPVLLVGDIDRGGVFAQLYGTMKLLEPEEQKRICGFIINKFRGDPTILEPGLRELEEKTGVPVLGVLPYLDIHLEEEDSLYDQRDSSGEINVAVIRLPRISNATDFLPLEEEEHIRLQYVTTPKELEDADLIILPGTKSTMQDLNWLRSAGLEAKILQHARRGTPILGICGGYQMLGEEILDPQRVEGWESMRGMGLLPMVTEFRQEKTRTVISGKIEISTGFWQCIAGKDVQGYEIHMGSSEFRGGEPFALIGDRQEGRTAGNTAGTYLHGFFDDDGLRRAVVETLCKKKEITPGKTMSFREDQERQYDLVADALQDYLDMKSIRRIIGMEQ